MQKCKLSYNVLDMKQNCNHADYEFYRTGGVRSLKEYKISQGCEISQEVWDLAGGVGSGLVVV